MYEEVSEYKTGYFVILYSIGSLHLKKHDILKAKIYIDEAKAIFEKYFGVIENCPWPVALQLYNTLGDYSIEVKQYTDAIKYYKKVVEVAKDDPVLSAQKLIAQNGIATSLSYLKDWKNAQLLYNSIYKDYAEVMLENLELKMSTLRNMAISSMMIGETVPAFVSLRNYNSAAYDYISSVFLHFSETEREYFWNELGWQLNVTNNMVAYQLQTQEILTVGFSNNAVTRRYNSNFFKLLENLVLIRQD